ncbi:YcfL family protein [Vibrio sp. RC27]
MMKRWLLVLTTMIILAGCSSSPSVGLSVEGKFQQVIMDDSRTADTISVEGVSSAEEQGHSKGIVRVRNKTAANVDIQYRFHWYNEQGLEVNLRPSAWNKLTIFGHDVMSLSEVSLSPKGKEFRVQIREYSH